MEIDCLLPKQSPYLERQHVLQPECLQWFCHVSHQWDRQLWSWGKTKFWWQDQHSFVKHDDWWWQVVGLWDLQTDHEVSDMIRFQHHQADICRKHWALELCMTFGHRQWRRLWLKGRIQPRSFQSMLLLHCKWSNHWCEKLNDHLAECLCLSDIVSGCLYDLHRTNLLSIFHLQAFVLICSIAGVYSVVSSVSSLENSCFLAEIYDRLLATVLTNKITNNVWLWIFRKQKFKVARSSHQWQPSRQ